MSDALATMLKSPGVERLATGFGFTEGPLWHPEGFLYFVDLRRSQLLRWQPGKGVEIVREHTGEGNGLTFDRQGRLIMCEGANRRVSRTEADGSVVPLVERWQGKRLNRPNDVVCHSDGSLYFTDPGMRVQPAERDLDSSPVFRVTPDGIVSSATAECEYPKGLAFSPDERTLFVSNTRTRMFIHAFDVQPDGSLTNHRTFASMSPPEESVPDGMKVDVEGRIFCTGPGGTWVFDPSGIHLGTMRSPEIPANCAFGGADYRTLFLTARTSLYAVRVKVPGIKVL